MIAHGKVVNFHFLVCFGARTWADAISDGNGLADGSCGLTDGSSPGNWRLPNVKEIQNLVDYGRYNPALPSGILLQM